MPKDTTELFGQSVRLSQLPVTSPYHVGFFSSFARGASYAWGDVGNRWASIFDDGGTISAEDFGALIGERNLQSDWYPGMTTGLAKRLIDEHEHAQWASQFDTSMVGQFMGALAPSLLDPVSIATLPVGGFTRGVGMTLAATLKANTLGGVKVAGASFVPEIASERQTYGEIRPLMLGFSLAAPVVFAPALTLPVWALSGRTTDGPLATGVANTSQVRRFDNMEEITEGVENSIVAARMPPPPKPKSAEALPPAPKTRLAQMFDDYGGVDKWMSDFALRDARAVAYAAQRGIDPESTALRAFVDAEANRQAVVRDVTPETISRQIDALNKAARGEAKPPSFASHPAFSSPNIKLPRQLAGAKPRYAFGPKQFTLSFESDIDRAAYIAAQKTPSKRDAEYVAFARKATGLTEEQVRAHGQQVRARIKSIARDAPAGSIAVKSVPIITEQTLATGAQRTITNYNQQLFNDGQSVIDDPKLTAKERKAKAEAVAAKIKRAANTPREVSGDFDQRSFLDAVDAARLTGNVAAIVEPPPATVTAGPRLEDDIAAFAREHGVSPEELDSTRGLLERVEAAMMECGGGN